MKKQCRLITKTISAAAVFLFAVVTLFAADPDGKSIIQQVHDVKDPKYLHTLIKMDLIEKNGSTESRIVEEWSQDLHELTYGVMVFKSPASVKDTRFLLKENKGRDDDKWIYLPALRSTRRIAASEGSKSFMGTDASYDDLSTREVDDDTHKRLADVSKNGYDCYQVKSTPINLSDSSYSYRIICVDKKTKIPVYEEMYDKKGKLYKVLVVEKIQNVKGYDIIMSTLFTNKKTGHATRLTIQKIEVDKPVSNKIFTPDFLNTGRL